MTLTVQPLEAPLRIDETGVVRVADTRITLDLVVSRFQEGASPEEIVHSYDTLRLKDVYLVLSYYLSHKVDVEDYLRQREEQAAAVRQKLEAAGVTEAGFLDKLKARAAAQEH